jgi:hypothetical protein
MEFGEAKTVMPIGVTAITLLFSLVSSAFATTSETVAYLEPPGKYESYLYRQNEYAKLIRHTLLVPDKCLIRMLELPPFDLESSVAIIERPTANGRDVEYRVIVRRMTSSLWQFQNRDGQKRNHSALPAVDQRAAVIPRSTALAIAELWRTALARRRPLKYQYLQLDKGTSAFFAEVKDIGVWGELPPSPSRSLDQMHTLGGLLMDYCEPSLSHRSSIAKTIERSAKRLIPAIQRD